MFSAISAFAAARGASLTTSYAATTATGGRSHANLEDVVENDDDLLVETTDRSIEDSGDDEEDELSVQPAGEPQFTNFQLSTWRPTKHNVLEKTDDTIIIRMSTQDTATFLGQYSFEVKSGVVTVYGASYAADGKSRRVFAPSTHALPAIKCLSNEAVVELSKCSHTMRSLSRMSPLYRHIWNSSVRRELNAGETSLSTRSFTFVCAAI